MKRSTLVALLSMGALALPPAAVSAGTGYEKRGMQSAGMQGAQQEARPRGQQGAQQASRIYTVSGSLVDLRTARIRQDPRPHLLARVRLSTGRTAVIDLGRADLLRDQDLRFQRGQGFEAQGVQGRINQRPVLVAQRFRPQGQRVFQVSRFEARGGQQALQRRPQQQGWSPLPAPGQRQQATPQPSQRPLDPAAQARRTVRGEVVETRELKLRGVDERHNFAKIRTPEGRIVVVDLGPSRALEGLILEQGERAVVRGTAARVNDRPVLVARDVAQVARLDRSDFLAEPQVQSQPPQRPGLGGS